MGGIDIMEYIYGVIMCGILLLLIVVVSGKLMHPA